MPCVNDVQVESVKDIMLLTCWGTVSSYLPEAYCLSIGSKDGRQKTKRSKLRCKKNSLLVFLRHRLFDKDITELVLPDSLCLLFFAMKVEMTSNNHL